MVRTVLKALELVDKRNYSIINPTVRNDEDLNYSRTETNPEQAFSADLQRHIANEFDNLDEYNNCEFYVTGELYKRTEPNFDDERYEASFRRLIDQQGIKPDILIHRGQHINDVHSQLLALELKTDKDLSQSKFNKDLFKMFFYVKELNFSNAIFVIANNSKSKILGYLDSYKNNFYYKKDDRIKIVVKEKFGYEPSVILCN